MEAYIKTEVLRKSIESVKKRAQHMNDVRTSPQKFYGNVKSKVARNLKVQKKTHLEHSGDKHGSFSSRQSASPTKKSQVSMHSSLVADVEAEMQLSSTKKSPKKNASLVLSANASLEVRSREPFNSASMTLS